MRKREKVEIMIREAIPADAKDIIAFSKKTGAETPYLAYGAEGLELSEAFEELYLEDLMEKDNNVMLIATINNKQLIGLASVGATDKPKLRHVGEVGITVEKEYWGFGIGSVLMEEIETWAIESGVIRRLELTVHGENERAIHLYLLNRDVLVTPFHNMTLVAPNTTRADVDRLVSRLDDALSVLCGQGDI